MSAVGKIINGAAPGLFRIEAYGLATLCGTGQLATPDVLAVTDRLLLLVALLPRDDSAGSWEAFGRDLAGAHRAVVSDRFGWPADDGETSVRLNLVAAWRDAKVFTDAERAALELAEQGTRIADAAGGVTDEVWANAAKHYDAEQLSALVCTIAMINAYNRLNVISQNQGGDYRPGQWG